MRKHKGMCEDIEPWVGSWHLPGTLARAGTTERQTFQLWSRNVRRRCTQPTKSTYMSTGTSHKKGALVKPVLRI